MTSRLRIIVTGQIATFPFGGVAWDWLNYLLGLRTLGYDVYYYEETSEWVYNPMKDRVIKSTYNLEYLKNVMCEFGFSKKWCYCIRRTRRTDFQKNSYFGIDGKNIQKMFSTADIILNLCGACNLGLIKNIAGKRIYLDSDPMSTQLKILKREKNLLSNIKNHDYFFTYGENIENKDCRIPVNKNTRWKTTRYAVFLDAWKFKINRKASKFTTVSNWQSYKGFIYRGKRYSGYKSVEFMRFADIPSLAYQPLELAVLAGKKRNIVMNLSKMKSGGWSIADAKSVSKNWRSYKRYIYDSKAEFSVAKNMYVKAKTSWFSGRSTCYLAAGKPVVLQETGFSKFIQTGKGLFSFNTKQEAVDAINEINNNYEYHCYEARKIAEKYFDSNKVLRKMLKQCGLKN